MKKLFTIFTLAAVIYSGSAQVPTDSLIAISNNVRLADTVRLDALHQLANAFMRTNPDSCRHYALQYENLAVALKSDDDVANAYHLIGISHFFQGDLQNSTSALNRSLKFRGEKGDPGKKAATLNVIGAVYMQQGNHALAMENYMRCLKLSEQVGERRGISASHHNIGRIYAQQKDLEKALQHFRKSLETKDTSDLVGISDEYEVIGSTYADLGSAELAEEYLLKALELRERAGNPVRLGMSYSNLGQFYMKPGTMDKSMDYLHKSLKQANAVNDPLGIVYANIMFAEAYQLLEKPQLAQKHAEDALNLARSVEDKRLTSEAAKELSSIYRIQNKPKPALEMFELYISLRDSLQSEENQREVLRHEYQYQYEKEALTDSLEFAKREAVLEERTEKQRIGLAAAGGGLFLVIALAFAIYTGKKKSDELLLNILPEETAKELKEKGHADAKLIENVTVIFTDFKGFTALAEQLSPKELVQDLNECFSAFDRIMEKYNIEKIKTIGDAYMAAGGLPTPNSTHAVDAINAALEMRDFVEMGKQKKIEQGLPYFEIRIGIHTGPVVAGIVGIKKFQYDIWGDTVNTASRMESSGDVGKINVSQSTYELVKDQFAFEARGKVVAKGKGELEMYFAEPKV